MPSDKFAISDKETLKVICKDFELSTAVKELVSNMNWEEKYPTVSPIFPQMSNELFFDILVIPTVNLVSHCLLMNFVRY